MIALFCILIVLGLSHCDDLPLKIDLKSSNDRINNEIETLTRQNSTLPQFNSLEEIRIYNSDVKNEVIRRQNPQETAETTTNDNQNLTSATTPQSTESANVSTTTTTTTSDSVRDGSSFVDASTPAPASSTSTGTNLVALEESFGGTTRAPDPVLPTRRRSGLYFLVDWNSFLEVGDDDSEKINLRFQPKVGDRTRFLPVTVP